MNDSVTFAWHGVREIGLKSSHDLGEFTWGIARIWAFFRDLGKVPDAKQWFIRTESGRTENKANPHMSFAGISPGKVERCVFTLLISLYISNALSAILPSLGQSSRSEAFSWGVMAEKVVQMEVRNALTSLDLRIHPL